eukprot:3740142-Amphidinium_carterae.1
MDDLATVPPTEAASLVVTEPGVHHHRAHTHTQKDGSGLSPRDRRKGLSAVKGHHVQLAIASSLPVKESLVNGTRDGSGGRASVTAGKVGMKLRVEDFSCPFTVHA